MEITPKTPWKERRIKSGSFLDRKLSADLLKVRRKHDSNIREIEKRTEYSAFMVAVCLLGALFLMVVFCRVSHADTIQPERLANAIYRAENSKTFPYGIMHHYKHTTPRQACLNSIKSAERRYKRGDFIVFLGQTYSPPAINPNWVRLVKYFLAHPRKDKICPIG